MSVFQSRHKDIEVFETQSVTVVAGDGRRWTDAMSGMFNLPFGYSCQPIKDATIQALNCMPFHPKEHFYSPRTQPVADRLLEKCRMQGGSVLFLNGGSEAIEGAIAMAIEVQSKMLSNRVRLVARRYSYHGATLGARSVSGCGSSVTNMHNQSGYEMLPVNPPFDIHYNGAVVPGASVDDVERVIQAAGVETVGALIYEPVQHLKGMHPTVPEYIRGLRKICSDNGIVMIADEIVTGGHRTGPFLGTHLGNVTPDIAVLGKGISGGYAPASCIVAAPNIARCFDADGDWRRFGYSHTYAANPVSLAAIEASLNEMDKLESDYKVQELHEAIQLFAERLRAIPCIRRVDAVGCLMGFSLTGVLGPDAGKRLEKRCFDRGVILRGEEDWACLVPSFSMGMKEWAFVEKEVENAIYDIAA